MVRVVDGADCNESELVAYVFVEKCTTLTKYNTLKQSLQVSRAFCLSKHVT